MSAEVAVSQVESNLTVESANHVEDIESPAEENGDKQHEVEETTNENQQGNICWSWICVTLTFTR